MSYGIYLEEAMENKMPNAPKSNDELELVIKEAKNSLEKEILVVERNILVQEEIISKNMHDPKLWNPHNLYSANSYMEECKKKLKFFQDKMAELFPEE
jgi:hypothetical protein